MPIAKKAKSCKLKAVSLQDLVLYLPPLLAVINYLLFI